MPTKGGGIKQLSHALAAIPRYHPRPCESKVDFGLTSLQSEMNLRRFRQQFGDNCPQKDAKEDGGPTKWVTHWLQYPGTTQGPSNQILPFDWLPLINISIDFILIKSQFSKIFQYLVISAHKRTPMRTVSRPTGSCTGCNTPVPPSSQLCSAS